MSKFGKKLSRNETLDLLVEEGFSAEEAEERAGYRKVGLGFICPLDYLGVGSIILNHDKVFRTTYRIGVHMKVVLLLFVISLTFGCDKGQDKKKTLACVMTPEKLKAVEDKIKADIDKHEQLRKEDISSKKPEALDEILKQLKTYLILVYVPPHYSTIKQMMTEFTEQTPLENIKRLYVISDLLIDTFILTPWRKAIDVGEDFDEVLRLNGQVLKDYEILKILECYKQNLAQMVGELDKSKYSKTLELYATSIQAYELFKNPQGSLLSFEQTVRQMQSGYHKIRALADLEFQQ